MCSEEIESEVEAIQAIYCGPDEFKLHQRWTGADERSETIFTVLLKSEDGRLQLSVTYTLTKDYPHLQPGISVASDTLGRDVCTRIKKDVIKYMNDASLISHPMILDINMWLQQNMSGYSDSSQMSQSPQPSENSEEFWHALLHLDHMRAKAKYVKTIEKWTSELALTGHLVFSDKLILILLCGSRQNIKEYIKRQKTVNVDVDSKGRSCKERMLSVLVEEPSSGEDHGFVGFSVIEVHPKNLRKTFSDWALTEMYEKYVENI